MTQVLDLAEASADPGDGTGTASVGEASGSSTGWRKWFAKAEKTEPLRLGEAWGIAMVVAIAARL